MLPDVAVCHPATLGTILCQNVDNQHIRAPLCVKHNGVDALCNDVEFWLVFLLGAAVNGRTVGLYYYKPFSCVVPAFLPLGYNPDHYSAGNQNRYYGHNGHLRSYRASFGAGDLTSATRGIQICGLRLTVTPTALLLSEALSLYLFRAGGAHRDCYEFHKSRIVG